MENQTQIRKISIGPNYKDSMHYSVEQEVYGGHTINSIIKYEDGSVGVFIKKGDELKPWKWFNANVAFTLEYNLEY